MPNWARNVIKAIGTQEHLERFRRAVASERSVFDFQKITPMPESLHIADGSFTNTAMLAYALMVQDVNTMETVKKYLLKGTYYDENSFERDLREAKALREKWNGTPLDADKTVIHYEEHPANDFAVYAEYGRVYLQNIREHGFPTWYEWACENWWTKWNAADAKIGEIANNDDGTSILSIWFATAWTLPGGILQKMAQMFPEIAFSGRWNVENEWIDHFWVAKGDDIHVIEADNETELRAACACWSYDYDKYIACLAEYA